MPGRTSALLASIAVMAALLMGGALLLRHERARHSEALAKLEETRQRLEEETRRARAVSDALASLNERVARLEDDNRRLRSAASAPLRRTKPPAAALAEPAAIAAAGLLPLSEYRPAIEPLALTEPLAATAAINWTVHLPAGAPASFEHAVSRGMSDPAFMKKMYVSFALLQAADTGTTLASLRMGAIEANPLLHRVSRNPAALIALKGGVAVGTIYTMERLRLKNPLAAAIAMAAVNSTLAVVAVNNARVMATQK
jgi:uncharacterized protein DUF5658